MSETRKSRSFSLAELVRDELIPKLEIGAKNGSITLNASECDRLCFFLRTSVPLEPFLETFVDMIHSTLEESKKGE
jgi:hypothetical protein